MPAWLMPAVSKGCYVRFRVILLQAGLELGRMPLFGQKGRRIIITRTASGRLTLVGWVLGSMTSP